MSEEEAKEEERILGKPGRKCPPLRLWELLDELAANRTEARIRILFHGKRQAVQWMSAGGGLDNREVMAVLVWPGIRGPGTLTVLLEPAIWSKDPC
jgi:hypothetical protein